MFVYSCPGNRAENALAWAEQTELLSSILSLLSQPSHRTNVYPAVQARSGADDGKIAVFVRRYYYHTIADKQLDMVFANKSRIWNPRTTNNSSWHCGLCPAMEI